MGEKEEIKKRILRFLKENSTGVIATVSAKNEPEAATINYTIDDDFNLYFIARQGARKFANLAVHPEVGLVIGTDPKVPAMAEIQGVAHVVPEPPKHIADYFAQGMTSDDPQWWPLFKSRAMDFKFFRVEITWLRWLDLASSGDFHTFKGNFYEIG